MGAVIICGVYVQHPQQHRYIALVPAGKINESGEDSYVECDSDEEDEGEHRQVEDLESVSQMRLPQRQVPRRARVARARAAMGF